ncbi:sulfite exporter TauE/SafE family protein [Spiroplasma sp. DGKH1]|uniref:sulfite exporter TauE/SafE family protein n=1 Tax=Spiroplasma sp. DGKH1 TaxID=3050074 RepID=UPI0034C6612C
MFFNSALSSLSPVGYIILLLIFAGAVAFLGNLSGVGGGVLHIPVMVWVLTIPVKEIKFVSTILVFASALISTAISAIKKKLNYPVILVALVVAIPTVFFGNWLNNKINERITTIIIVVLLSYISIQLIINQYLLKKKTVVQKELVKKWYHIVLNDNPPKYLNIFSLAAISFIAAMITSLTGMGGGVIIMPFLLLFVKLNIKDSTPISHSIIMITSLLAIIIEPTMGDHNYFLDTPVMTNVLVPMLVGAVGGTISAIFVKKYIKQENIILWILIILIWISIVKMIVDLVMG